MNEKPFEHDKATARLLKKSDSLINKSRMLFELAVIQSKTVSRLFAESDRLISEINRETKIVEKDSR